MKNYDVLIVGGGAAGFFSAINIAEANPSLKIAILERRNAVLIKVKISGGGRCNVTHAEFEPKPLSLHYPMPSYLQQPVTKRRLLHGGRRFHFIDPAVARSYISKVQRYGFVGK